MPVDKSTAKLQISSRIEKLFRLYISNFHLIFTFVGGAMCHLATLARTPSKRTHHVRQERPEHPIAPQPFTSHWHRDWQPHCRWTRATVPSYKSAGFRLLAIISITTFSVTMSRYRATQKHP